MRKFLGTLAMVVIAIAVVGGMRSWFTVQKSDHGDSTEVHLLINREKIRTDTANARDIARELRENLGRKIEQKLDARALSQPEMGPGLHSRANFECTLERVTAISCASGTRQRLRTRVPPETTCTFVNPACRRMHEAMWARRLVWQVTAVSADMSNSPRRLRRSSSGIFTA